MKGKKILKSMYFFSFFIDRSSASRLSSNSAQLQPENTLAVSSELWLPFMFFEGSWNSWAASPHQKIFIEISVYRAGCKSIAPLLTQTVTGRIVVQTFNIFRGTLLILQSFGAFQMWAAVGAAHVVYELFVRLDHNVTHLQQMYFSYLFVYLKIFSVFCWFFHSTTQVNRMVPQRDHWTDNTEWEYRGPDCYAEFWLGKNFQA